MSMVAWFGLFLLGTTIIGLALEARAQRKDTIEKTERLKRSWPQLTNRGDENHAKHRKS